MVSLGKLKKCLELKLKHTEHPSLEADVFLCCLLSVSKVDIRLDKKVSLSLKQKLILWWWLWQRKKFIPIAYITGFQTFCGHQVQVNKHTLIPRDETEFLVEAVDISIEQNNYSKILEIGTGSGCILMALACKHPRLELTATDISNKTLQIAKKNLKRHKVQWFQGNLLSPIKSKAFYDVIIANLPYVPKGMISNPDIKHEPSKAIYVAGDGLDLYRKLLEQIQKKHISFNELWIEFLPEQTADLQALCAKHGLDFKVLEVCPFIGSVTPLTPPISQREREH